MGSTQKGTPALWDLSVWSPPPQTPRGLRGRSHPREGTAQSPWATGGWDSEAAGRLGSQQKAQHRSAGQTGPRGQQRGPAQLGASGLGAAVGRRLRSASGSGRERKGAWLTDPVHPWGAETPPPKHSGPESRPLSCPPRPPPLLLSPTCSNTGHASAPTHGQACRHTDTSPGSEPRCTRARSGRGGPCRAPCQPDTDALPHCYTQGLLLPSRPHKPHYDWDSDVAASLIL